MVVWIGYNYSYIKYSAMDTVHICMINMYLFKKSISLPYSLDLVLVDFVHFGNSFRKKVHLYKLKF